MSFRRVSVVTSTAAFLLLSKGSFGQTTTPSATDRQAARDLYIEGSKAQNDGKYDVALDRFRRAQAVFPAVTNELHIAECQASLGQLVESAESYRAVINTQLASDAPAAFKTAQQQASAELPQVEPRIPQLEIDVTPNGIAGLEVTIDGQTVNPALLGVRRPINPGPHHVVARAYNYANVETDVTVKERQRDAVLPITMHAQTAVAGVPAGAAAGAADAPGLPTPAPYNNDPSAAGKPAPVPAEYSSQSSDHPPSHTSVLLGAKIGVAGIGGSLASGFNAGDYVGAGGSIGAEIGLRFAEYLYVGVTGEYVGYGKGTQPTSIGTSSIHSEMFGANLGVMSNPHGVVGFYGELGAGYRILDLTYDQTYPAVGSYHDPISLSGAEFLLGLGMTIHVKSLMLIPKFTLGFGSFTSHDENSCTNRLAGYSCPTISSFQPAGHVTAALVIGGYFDKDL